MTEDTEILSQLEELFGDVKDITDPCTMDKVLMLLEEKRIEEEDYMELLVDKLKGQEITWERPWYQNVSNSLTRKLIAPSDEQQKYETGPFTQKECKKITKNWLKFVRRFEIPDKLVCLARWRNRGKCKKSRSPEEYVRFFVTAYLARGLKRDLYQVNRYFLQTFGYPVKLKSYTPIEEKIMDICFYHNPNKAVTILSSVLGREPRGFYKRLSQYHNGKPEKKRLKWTLELASTFLNHLLTISECSLEELKNNQLDRSIWVELAKAMDQQYCFLQAFWYGKLHVQLFVQCNVKNSSLRKILCKKLLKSRYKIWSDIRWKELVLEFPDGFTHTFLHKFSRALFESIPNYLTSPLSEVIAQALSNKWRTRRLRCLELNAKGKLKYVHHEKKIKQAMLEI